MTAAERVAEMERLLQSMLQWIERENISSGWLDSWQDNARAALDLVECECGGSGWRPRKVVRNGQ